jgi:type IV secretory pathway TrbL component
MLQSRHGCTSSPPSTMFLDDFKLPLLSPFFNYPINISCSDAVFRYLVDAVLFVAQVLIPLDIIISCMFISTERN